MRAGCGIFTAARRWLRPGRRIDGGRGLLGAQNGTGGRGGANMERRFGRYGRNVLATLAAATAMWVAAGFWHNHLGRDVFTGEGEDLTALALAMTFAAYMIVATVMARAYLLVPPERRRAWAAVRIGAWGGVLWAFPHALLNAAGMGAPLLPVLGHSALHVIEGMIGGLILNAAYQLGRRPGLVLHG